MVATQQKSALPTPEEFLARARSLKLKFRERADECERIRRVPDASVADFLKADMNTVMLPKRFGGCEYGWDVWCECLNELAQGDASQAWAMMVHNEYVQLVGACSKEVQDEIWGENPQALISSSFAPVGKVERKSGGYTLSTGAVRWTFSSGIDEATWVIVGSFVPGRGHTFFLVPRSQVKIIDDWYVTGLAGTGSKAFTIDEAFVPEYRTITDQELNEGRGPGITPGCPAIYRYPRKAGAGLSIATVPVGAAIGMLERFAESTRARVLSGGDKVIDQATALRISESAAELDAARTIIRENARESMRTLQSGEEMTKEQRLVARRTAGYAALLAQRATERILAAAGPEGILRKNPLQRAFRDVHAGTNHIGVSWETSATGYGELVSGLEPLAGLY
jgi:alkylation response protein AidB-like acyl-CoA dehydrogenase